MEYTKELGNHLKTIDFTGLPVMIWGFSSLKIKAQEFIPCLIEEIERLQSLTQWVPVTEIKNTHSGNRVIIHMANDFIVIATYYKEVGGNGHFRNDNGSIVAFSDVIEYKDVPQFTRLPTEGVK